MTPPSDARPGRGAPRHFGVGRDGACARRHAHLRGPRPVATLLDLGDDLSVVVRHHDDRAELARDALLQQRLGIADAQVGDEWRCLLSALEARVS